MPKRSVSRLQMCSKHLPWKSQNFRPPKEGEKLPEESWWGSGDLKACGHRQRCLGELFSQELKARTPWSSGPFLTGVVGYVE
ncbi:hypothetical protein VULLAG_LOCUS5733 [Vulpes lagopus]